MKRFLITLMLAAALSLTQAEEPPAAPAEASAPEAAVAKQPEQAQQVVPDRPVIDFSSREHDFREVFKGDTAEHIFTVFNRGGQDLVLERIKTSCGCTAAILSDQIIKPGETGEIKVNYDTSKGMGAIEKKVTVISNDPENEQAILKVKLFLQVEVEAVPNTAYFGAIFADKEDNNRRVRVTSPTLEDLNIREVAIDSEHVAYDVSNATDGSNGKVISFRIKNSAPLGEFSALATVTTNSEKQPTITVPIEATVYGDVEVRPLRLYLAPHFPTQVRENTITIRDRAQTGDFKVESVIDRSGYLNLRVEPVREGYEYSIIATTKTDNEVAPSQGQYAGVLEVITNREGEEKIPVNYSGFVKAADVRAAQ